MDIGAYIFPTDYTLPIRQLAPALEERGFESLFVPEHTHIPVSRRTEWPGGGELPREYANTFDPFVLLAVAAAVTQKLLLGTGICLVPQREPIVTAKVIASLDVLSNGRFIFGIGGGWNVDEMENHGASYKTRFKQMRESVLAMKALWTEHEASFHGEFYNFDPVWSDPKPTQKPHPPIILGGESDYTLNRIVEYCDGWLPRARGGFDAKESMARLKAAAEKAGRDPKSLSVSVFGAPPDRETLDTYEAAGVDRALFTLPSDPPDDVMRRIDDYAKLIT